MAASTNPWNYRPSSFIYISQYISRCQLSQFRMQLAKGDWSGNHQRMRRNFSGL